MTSRRDVTFAMCVKKAFTVLIWFDKTQLTGYDTADLFQYALNFRAKINRLYFKIRWLLASVSYALLNPHQRLMAPKPHWIARHQGRFRVHIEPASVTQSAVNLSLDWCWLWF